MPLRLKVRFQVHTPAETITLRGSLRYTAKHRCSHALESLFSLFFSDYKKKVLESSPQLYLDQLLYLLLVISDLQLLLGIKKNGENNINLYFPCLIFPLNSTLSEINIIFDSHLPICIFNLNFKRPLHCLIAVKKIV